MLIEFCCSCVKSCGVGDGLGTGVATGSTANAGIVPADTADSDETASDCVVSFPHPVNAETHNTPESKIQMARFVYFFIVFSLF
jgi:hypothetical protein